MEQLQLLYDKIHNSACVYCRHACAHPSSNTFATAVNM